MLGVSKMDLQTRGNIKRIVPFKKVVRQIYCFQIISFCHLTIPLLLILILFLFLKFQLPKCEMECGP